MGSEGRSENPRPLAENRVTTVWFYWKRRFQGSKRGEARSSGFLVTVSGQGSAGSGQSHTRQSTWTGSAPVFLAF